MTSALRPVLVVVGVLVLILGLLAAHWLGFPFGHGDRDDRAAQRLWESKEPAAYSFDYAHCSGMCRLCPLHVSVRHGEVTDAVSRVPDCEYAEERAPTIEGVFALESADRHGPHTESCEIAYDRVWGFPASVDIRCPDGWSDCGSGYSVTHFRVEPDAGS